MRPILHVLTKPNDPFASEIIAQQAGQPENAVAVADLTVPEPDYTALLEKIFAADSVAVW